MKAPREKAEELVDFYNSILINYIQNEFERKYAVIECVLKAVDEMMNYDINAKSEPQFVIERRIQEYYQEVKEEIEKLS